MLVVKLQLGQALVYAPDLCTALLQIGWRDKLNMALLQIEIWVDDVPFKKYLETENPVD